jgi:hypothetical protein
MERIISNDKYDALKSIGCRSLSRYIRVLIVAMGSPVFLRAQSGDSTRRTYPRPTAYMSFIVPVVKLNKNGVTSNFADFHNGFTIGFPVGVNVFYSDRFGFSFELTPGIKAISGVVKDYNLQFAPGVMLRSPHGFTFISRLAFETAGRFGVTPVFAKVVLRTRPLNYFIAGSAPIRFGNNEPPSIGANLQFGFIFN